MKIKATMLKSLVVLGLITGVGFTTLSVINPTDASAKTNYNHKRSRGSKIIWEKRMGKHAFYTTTKTGGAFSKHLYARYFKLKEHPKTTWYSYEHMKIKKPNGHVAIYYKVYSGNKQHHVWVWRGYLKKGHNPFVDKYVNDSSNYVNGSGNTNKGNSNNSSSNNNSNKGNSNGSGNTTNDGTKFDQAQFNKGAFYQLNAERTKRGLSPVKENASLVALDAKRAVQLQSNFDHTDSNGKHYKGMIAKEMNIMVPRAESIAQLNNGANYYTAKDSYNEGKDTIKMYIYDDAESGNGHRDMLLSADYVSVGIGSYYKDYTVTNSINFYSSTQQAYVDGTKTGKHMDENSTFYDNTWMCYGNPDQPGNENVPSYNDWKASH